MADEITDALYEVLEKARDFCRNWTVLGRENGTTAQSVRYLARSIDELDAIHE